MLHGSVHSSTRPDSLLASTKFLTVSLSLTPITPGSAVLRHNFKLYKNLSSVTVRAKFFSERIVNVWNNLPDSVDFSTLASFSRTLKIVDFSKYVRYS